jgi:hypothetical protein
MSGEQPVGSTQSTVTTISESIPPVNPPSQKWWPSGWWPFAEDERKQFEKDGSQSHNVRRWAAYGGLIVAIILYAAGLYAIAFFLGVLPGAVKVTPDMWHIVVAILIALFTVPTVLVIAILKVTSPAQDGELPTTVHEAIGKMVEKAVDKFLD